MTSNIPKKPGFYWAKWRIAEDGTHEADLMELSVNDWEVVDVYENCNDETSPEYLRVQVSGVRESQSLENFIWGEGSLKRTVPLL